MSESDKAEVLRVIGRIQHDLWVLEMELSGAAEKMALEAMAASRTMEDSGTGDPE